MSATIIEIGRELYEVKRRLEYGQFLDWVTTACELSPRHAQLMMRAAEWAEGKDEIVSYLEPTSLYLLAAPSTPETVRQEVLSSLEEGQRPAPRIVKAMIRAANERMPSKEEKTGEPKSHILPEAARTEFVERREILSQGAAPEVERPDGAPPETKEAETAAPLRQAPQQRNAFLLEEPPHGRNMIYPDIDPLKDQDPPWINGALQLIPLLAEALPLKDRPANR
jgi:hypothetical protein